MSVQKLVAEADKFFDKGKVPDGIAKLKQALTTEPLNQLVATKLATVLVQNKEPLEAAKVYGGLAKRLSDAGKSSVAIAIYKQALELAPDDIALRFRYACECEAVGKLGDAFLQAQIVLTYYLRRKKFFDASNVLPVMARAQPKDDKVKQAWIEVMQLCQADQKLVNLLVALCGPPGVASPDFPVGGDPSTLTPVLYEGLKKLVPFYPRDPKVAYAVAWCAYRRGARADCMHFLHECLRREPDFCLAILLFARILAEDKKLNEALFLYRYYKERLGSDKNTDMLTLNRLLESFVEKNGWIKFTEDSGDLLDAAGFKASLTGKKEEAPTPQQVEEEEAAARRVAAPEGKDLELPPAEIELGGDAGATESMEIVTATGQSIQEASKQKKTSGTGQGDPLRMQAELIKATVEAAVAGMGNTNPQQTILQPVVLSPIQQAAVHEKLAESGPKLADQAAKTEEKEAGEDLEGFKGESVEFTSLIKRSDLEAAVAAPAAGDATRVATVDPADSEKTTVQPMADDKTTVQPISAAEEDADVEEEQEEETPAKKKLFNPLDHAVIPDSQATSDSLRLEGNEERTQMFSPMDVLDAANVMKNRELGNVGTKQIDVNRLAEEEKAIREKASEGVEGDKTKWRELKADGAGTQLFSPVEALKAANDSRKPHEVAMTLPPPVVPPAPPPVTPPSPPPPPVPSAAEAEPSEESLRDSGDATVVMKRGDLATEAPEEKTAPLPAPEAPVAQPVVAAPAGQPVMPVPPPPPPSPASLAASNPSPAAAPAPAPAPAPEHQTISLAEHTKTPVVAIDPSTPEAEGGIPAETAPPSEGPAFMPIPAHVAAKPGADDERVDLGDDLLEGPTRIFTQTSAGDKTEHLLKEIKHDLKNAAGERHNIEVLMKKADRFTAKRNYYLARKALRHAQALGADEEKVKARLREIRKLEFPEGLYNTMSSDVPSAKVDTSEVLERLELEFDLTEASGDSEELSALVEQKIEAILRENDPRTILDFGVGLHEMALFRQAEALFIRVVEEYPEFAFDAYYLAAVSKLSRRDYAGAASILKRLSSDAAKTDLEKIQIYYALGETFEKMRQRDRSREFFEKVAELDANYRNIRHKLDG